jgi:chaperonin GroEL
MEYNQPSQIVKDLNFGYEAREKVMHGVDKLTNAVKSTLGASGKCVIYEDAQGKPVITKDGVTVAESVVLYDPVENIGATLIKEAAKNTVKEAGDGTTTATVLAHSLLHLANEQKYAQSVRPIKEGILSALDKVNKYLNKKAVEVKGDMLESVAEISCNNDKTLGKIISQAYSKVGKDGVVLMEESETHDTYVKIVEGTRINCGLKSPHFVTDRDKGKAELDNPYVLIVSSSIPNIRKIQNVLEFVIKNKRSLLIVAGVEQQPMAALLANKVKGNIKVNVVDLPGFGPTKQDTIEDLAILTGAKVINEELGDDLDLIEPSVLGEAIKVITDDYTTVLQTPDLVHVDFVERVKGIEKRIKKEKNPFFKKKLRERLAMLNGKVAMIKVGADSKVEMKEKKDRVEDAIYATKAALQEGIIAGGGVALLDAAHSIAPENEGEEILLQAIKSPYATILDNAALEHYESKKRGFGIDVVQNKEVDMVKAGIIDPVLVTKTALKNAVSVATTIFSADCVINNIRVLNESS